MSQTDQPLRVALYTRVSTDMQANKEEGSLDTQEERLRSYLKSRGDGHEIRQVYREEGASGKSLDRPALQSLLKAVDDGLIDLVLVTRLDRLSRSLLDFYELHSRFEKKGVRFVSLNETFDTSSPVGRAMLKLVLVFAELEREQTADRTRTAMQARAERGLWNGGPPPLGYDSQQNGHLDINPQEADVVRLAFDKYIEMRSAPKVATWLNAQGYRQKRYVSRRKGMTGGKPFKPDTVRRMVRNRLYLREIEHLGETYTGKHDAIIGEELFERVQGILGGNAVNRRGPPLRAQHDYPLTGVAQCACGYALTSSAGTGRNGQTYFYYRCVGLSKKTRHVCDVRQVRAETLEDAVLHILREAARDPDLIAEAIAEANRLAGEQVEPLKRRVSTLGRELTEVEEEGRRTLAGILKSGVMDSDFARSLLSELETRRDALRRSLAEAEGKLAEREGEQLNAEMLVQALQQFDVIFDHLTAAEKRELLQLMLARVTVYKERIEVDLYDGRRAELFMELAGQGSGRGAQSGGSKEDGETKNRRPGKGGPLGPSRFGPAGPEEGAHEGSSSSRTPEIEETASERPGGRFVGGLKWLPRGVHRQNLGGGG